MAFTFALGRARTSSAGNPITFSYTVAAGDSLIVLLLNVASGTSRAGGAPTWGSVTLTQVNSTQKAAASPEASAEMWYMANPTPGTQTFTIPNTGALTILATVCIGRAGSGQTVVLETSNGGNNTSTNPTPGSVTTGWDGDIIFAVTAGGWQNFTTATAAFTSIAITDDGATGGGEQYTIQAVHGAAELSWTFGTSDDWGAVVGAFRAIPALNVENYKGFESISAGVISVTEKIR
jgi:hypothetical protein